MISDRHRLWTSTILKIIAVALPALLKEWVSSFHEDPLDIFPDIEMVMNLEFWYEAEINSKNSSKHSMYVR